MQYQQQFIRFLKSNHAYLSYRRNRAQNAMLPYTNRSQKTSNFIMQWVHLSSPQYISAAFCWDKTPQGGKYWSRMTRQWDIQRNKLSNYT